MAVSYNPEEQYLTAVIDGKLDMEAIERSMKEMNTMVDRHQCRTVLYDLRGIDLALETHEVYYIPRFMREEGNTDLKRAVVFPVAFEQDFSFFETVSANQGLNTRIFTEYDQALDWLLA